MKKQVENWLDAASDDIRLIEKIGKDESLTNMIAFHAEQAVEKSFKAVLEQYESKVPRIHNIIKLKELIEKYIKIDLDKRLLIEISEIYTETRYPSDLGLIPTGKPSIKTALNYKKFAKDIYKKVLAELSNE